MESYSSLNPVNQVKQVLSGAWSDSSKGSAGSGSSSTDSTLSGETFGPSAGSTRGYSHTVSKPTSPCIAGVSGGVDSMVMAHIVGVELGWPMVVAHVNYGLRGDDSDADEDLVRAWCAEKNIRFEALNAGSEVASMQSGNFQDHARDIRVRFYKKLKAQYRAWCTILAHHRDDQLETIMQKILRGAAPDHWTGMQAISGDLVRPLLALDKATLVHYARECGIPYREDRSNLSSNYARNLLRNEVFPKFEQPFPGWKENLLRLPEFAFLHKDLLSSLAMQQPGDRLNRAWWLALPVRVRPALLRYWIDERIGTLFWSRGSIKQLDDAQHLQTGARLSLPSGFFLMRDRDYFVLGGEQAKTEQDPVNICTTALKTEPVRAANLLFHLSTYNPLEHGRMLQLRMHNLPKRLVLRRWKHADRFEPLGLKGHQSVADHLAGRKFPAHLKEQVMVLEDKKGIIYALVYPGMMVHAEPGTLSELVRCTRPGEEVLAVQPVGTQGKLDAEDIKTQPR